MSITSLRISMPNLPKHFSLFLIFTFWYCIVGAELRVDILLAAVLLVTIEKVFVVAIVVKGFGYATKHLFFL